MANDLMFKNNHKLIYTFLVRSANFLRRIFIGPNSEIYGSENKAFFVTYIYTLITMSIH